MNKKYEYVSKVHPLKGETPKEAAATFLDADWTSEKAILMDEQKRYFTASTNGKIPRRFTMLGVFNCFMPYRDLVRELAA